jgi:nicotinamide-nucleotide amidase
LTTAESCTGGWVGQAITSVPGSSTWYERGFIVYSHLAKQEMLGVKLDTLEKYGAVSKEVAQAMAEGALQHSHAQVSIAITGIAGPATDNTAKEVGTVWFAFASVKKPTQTSYQHFLGDRTQVRRQAVEFALTELVDFLL